MTTANIIRPEVTNNFTVLPNVLFELGRHYPEIKPRDIGVLNYMFTKPEVWQPRTKDLAKAMNVSEWGVRQSLTRLIKLGFASYTRNNLGYTQWCISVPESLLPRVNPPRVEIPHEEIQSVLTNNEKTVITEKTTTRCGKSDFSVTENDLPVDYINEPTVIPEVTLEEIITTFDSAVSAVEIEEIVLETKIIEEIIPTIDETEILVEESIETVEIIEPIIETIEESIIEKEMIEAVIQPVIIAEVTPTISPEAELDAELPVQLTEVEKLSAKKTLLKASLDNIAHTVVLMALKAALNTGGIRSPIAYLNGLINKAKDGTLDTSKYHELQASKLQLNRSDEIRNLFGQHGDSILLDLVTNGVIHIPSFGYIQYDEVLKLGLLNEKWVKKYADIQLEKMSKAIPNKPFKTPFKKQQPAETRTAMSKEEFEAKRQAQIEMAMAMLNQQFSL